jgi:hypothetical protein
LVLAALCLLLLKLMLLQQFLSGRDPDAAATDVSS